MYDHKKVEKEILSFWEKEKIYEEVKENNKNGEIFYFCDGPPYATGEIHPGTGWNKCIKDAIIRYKRMKGFAVRSQPGYDTHGLPIEVKVEKELKIKNKNEIEKIGLDKFVKYCREFATRYIKIMNGQFKSLGVWMDFEKPYITYTDSYIDSSWKTLHTAWKQNLMHEGIYVLPYCYRCETTIANYELEYGEETDPSIYVKFKCMPNKKEEKKGDEEKTQEYLIIWTTTPWTLIANMAVMAHPTITYVRAIVENEIWIVAKERLEQILSITGKSAVITEEISGKKLEGKRYENPLQDSIKKHYERRVVLSEEYVALEDGTGLVHCAPGHGPEDFIIGKRFSIEAFSPVNEHGDYTEDAGDFAGKNVRESNPSIIELLERRGALLHQSRIRHRYPHCWRCKTPLIFLTTNQWFITISKIKDRMLEEIEKTEWYPDFAKERFKEFVSGAPDWCISRQRYWGIPLPIWRCSSCSSIRVISSKSELPDSEKIKELHRPYIDEVELACDCGKKMRRIPDVLDVWFDSGNAVWATLDDDEVKKIGEKTDLIIEGQDQIRGWFYSLLGSGIVRNGSCPYQRLLMHGFFVDEKGEKMSKSIGNFVPLEQILEKHGADSFRLWALSNTVWEELKFNWNDLKKAGTDINILFNLVVFLERFYSVDKNDADKAETSNSVEDIWLQSKTAAAVREFSDSFESYNIHRGVKALRKFVVDDISRFYMKVIKERIAAGDKKAEALGTLYTATLTALKMFCVIAPFVSEELYQNFFRKFEKKKSLSLHKIKDITDNAINRSMEKQAEFVQEITSAALLARQEANVKVRWPLKTLLIESSSHEVANAVNAWNGVLKSLVNVKNVSVVSKNPVSTGFISSSFSIGTIHIDSTVDEELFEEGILNEIKRRIQMLRKEAQLVEKDKINVFISGEKEMLGIVEKGKEKIINEVNAISIVCGNAKAENYSREFEIDGRRVTVAIVKK